MRVLNYFAVIAIIIGLMGWGKKNALDYDVQNLKDFRDRGIETKGMVTGVQVDSHQSRRGRRTESYIYLVEHTVPDGRKFTARLYGYGYSYRQYPFPIQIWYLPENPDRIMQVTEEVAEVPPEKAKDAAAMLWIGGGGALYWALIGAMLVRRKLGAGPAYTASH